MAKQTYKVTVRKSTWVTVQVEAENERQASVIAEDAVRLRHPDFSIVEQPGVDIDAYSVEHGNTTTML